MLILCRWCDGIANCVMLSNVFADLSFEGVGIEGLYRGDKERNGEGREEDCWDVGRPDGLGGLDGGVISLIEGGVG